MNDHGTIPDESLTTHDLVRGGAQADRIGSNDSTTDRAGEPSSVHRDQRSSQKSESSVDVEFLQRRCTSLEAQLEQLRTNATADLQNLQTDVLAKNREISRLKGEINKALEDSPEAHDAKMLLTLWRDVIRNGHKGTDVALDSDRGRAVMRALKSKKQVDGRTPAERVRRAILGCQYDDFAMGRTARQDRAFNDIAKHILRDSDRFEHFEALFEEHHHEGEKALAAQEPESLERQFVRHVYAEDCLLPHRPASKERPINLPPETPIDRVLGSLPGDWRALPNPDEWEAQCPAHDDHNPSLVIRRNPDGMVWIKCWAGCTKESILDALGLEWRDLWERSEQDTGAANYLSRPKHEIPEHLQTAMRQLLAREERRAA